MANIFKVVIEKTTGRIMRVKDYMFNETPELYIDITQEYYDYIKTSFDNVVNKNKTK